MKKSKAIAAVAAIIAAAALAGCNNTAGTETNTTAAVQNTDIIKVTLKDNGTSAADGVSVDGNNVTVTKAGNYSFSGSLSDGRIIVDAGKGDSVTLLLDGVNITDETGSAPIHVISAAAVTLTTGGDNSLLDNGGFFGSDISDTAAIWSDTDITINGTGSLVLSTPGKGIHSEKSITIDNGNISVKESDEGIEASLIKINGGAVYVVSTDDGINVSDGAYTADTLYINGGKLIVNAQGDGLDSNGSIVITGGAVFVDGPTGQDNAALDFDKTFTVSGGTIFAVGSAGMAAVPTDGSQSFISVNVSGKAGSTIAVKNTDGDLIATHTAAKDFASVIVSTPETVSGKEFTVYVDETEAGTAIAGEHKGGFGGFGGGFAPPNGEFAPPDGNFAPPDGEFAPPDGSFTPPEGGFAPPDGNFPPPNSGDFAFGNNPPPEFTASE
ncbi:MAG: carbohydrate-binding domain-containing protein [Ruminococcus sp.]|jgi:hypothetical protein|nr:carbohydrate-binding domain-containing protein [Ruminococcus sp.]